jgi:hypothetical protein
MRSQASGAKARDVQLPESSMVYRGEWHVDGIDGSREVRTGRG